MSLDKKKKIFRIPGHIPPFFLPFSSGARGGRCTSQMPHVPQCMLHSPPNPRSGDLTPWGLARCPRAQDLRCRGGKRPRAQCSQPVRGGTMARVRFRRRPGRGLLDRLWLSRPGGKRIPGRLGYKEKTGAFAEGSHDFGPLAVHRLPTWSCRVGSQRNWVGRSW